MDPVALWVFWPMALKNKISDNERVDRSRIRCTYFYARKESRMKKIALLAALVCLCTGAFAQEMRTSLKNAVLLENKSETVFSERQTYLYLLNGTELEICTDDGTFQVSEFYEQDTLNGGEPESEYAGRIDFSFTPVKTIKGPALKITARVADRDGLNLKGSTLEVAQDARGVKVNFKVKGTWTEKSEKVKTFDVLVSACAGESAVRPPLSAQQISDAVARNLKQHFHPAEK